MHAIQYGRAGLAVRVRLLLVSEVWDAAVNFDVDALPCGYKRSLSSQGPIGSISHPAGLHTSLAAASRARRSAPGASSRDSRTPPVLSRATSQVIEDCGNSGSTKVRRRLLCLMEQRVAPGGASPANPDAEHCTAAALAAGCSESPGPAVGQRAPLRERPRGRQLDRPDKGQGWPSQIAQVGSEGTCSLLTIRRSGQREALGYSTLGETCPILSGMWIGHADAERWNRHQQATKDCDK
jgi:hypothetical protein